jgi:hypothetical protein
MRFGCSFLISLERYEVHYRAGSDFFKILWVFSCLDFKKLTFVVKSNFELY